MSNWTNGQVTFANAIGLGKYVQYPRLSAKLPGQVNAAQPASGSGGSSNAATSGTPSPTPGASPTNPGTVTTGTQLTNGTIIYKYFRANGYTPMQAAGAIASIWGESTWNPESAGTGGRGLIGWTPAGKLPDSAFTGNPSKDMASQLPLILQFVSANGDQGAVNSMKNASTINQAAQIWGQQVERYGINDVHPTGVSLAAQIAYNVDGVKLAQ